MRRLVLIAVLFPSLASAASPGRVRHHEHAKEQPGAPQALGHYGDWVAATHSEAGKTVCYAFTYARAPQPGLSPAILTVTERPGGRDAVAISAGYAYPPGAMVQVGVNRANLEFYTAGQSAFARDGHAAVAALRTGGQAVAKGAGPRRGEVRDVFSLSGFGAAYAAISRACPAR